MEINTSILEIGQKLKRKFKDYQEVTINGISDEHISIKDSTGLHFVKIDDIPEYFTIVDTDKHSS